MAACAANEISQVRLQEIYSRTAAFYDEVVTEHQEVAKSAAIELLARRAGEAFLEVGVGTGWAFRRLLGATGAGDAVGLDLAPGMLDVARGALNAAGIALVPLLLGDTTRLPFAAGAFDCLLCTYTLEVLPEEGARAAAREMARVLRPGGRLVLAGLTDGESDDATFTADWRRRYEQDREYFGGARPLRLTPLVEAAGLIIKDRGYSGHGAGWPAEVILAVRAGS